MYVPALVCMIRYINEIKSLAINKKLKPLIGECNHLLALFNYHSFNFNEALKLLENNFNFALKNNLIRISKESKKLETIIRDDIKNFESIYGSIDIKTSILKKKITDESENMIKVFLDNYSRIYIPKKQVDLL